jgi:hypothetical protein
VYSGLFHGVIMRLFLLLTLLLFQTPQQQNKAHQESDNVSNTQPVTTTSQGIRCANEDTPAHRQEQTNNYDPLKDSLYRRYLCATIVGVAGGFIGIGILVWQTVMTRQSANAARDAAIAATTSSQAIINSERPWLFIDILVHNQAFSDKVPEHLIFSVSFQNYGKTPAEVVGCDHHTECLENSIPLPLPPEYTNQGSVMAHTRMVPPGDKWRYPGESAISATDYLLEDQWRDIRSSKKRLVHWGRIQYRDLIEEAKSIHELNKVGTIHETGFCYFWSPSLNEFLICGPVGYNKHT